jgi:cytochrome c oxidase subunit 3/cytochrome o ubiquinol oxidase subunit 3
LIIAPEQIFNAAQWGMIAFLMSEVAFFSTLIVTYLTFMGETEVGPTPREALSLGLVSITTACLLASSATIHLATKHRPSTGAFAVWWGLTIVLGTVFLVGTAYEWYDLVTKHQLTISRNLFGTTYYTLVGFHALHVTLGVIALSVVWLLARRDQLTGTRELGAELVAWYWHFVDVVWIVVFSIVYLIGR